jgi:16S rRNA (cytosine967-C5)-methyltransferase
VSSDRRSSGKPKRSGPPRGEVRGGRYPARRGATGTRPAQPRRDGQRRESFASRGPSTAAREGFVRRERSGPPREGARRGRTGPPRDGFVRRERAAAPRDGFVRRERSGPPREGARRGRTGPPREGFVRRERAAAPRDGFVRRERSGPPREGFAGRGRTGPPRDGFARRERTGPPRDGFARRERAATPREGYPKRRPGSGPREGSRPREREEQRPSFRPRGERPAARGERSAPPRERSGRPRPERERSERPRFDRGERPRFEREQAARPRPEREQAARPRPERAQATRPRPERAERPWSGPPRGERRPFERPRPERTAFHDEGGDQTGAVNRSRPVYPQGPNVRWRRDGKRSPSPSTWAAPQAHDRPRYPSDGGAPPRARVHERRSVGAITQDGPSLPADPREAALRILHAVDTRSAFSDRLLDGAHARPGADPRDRALLHELVKGTLRWRGRIDTALDARVHVGLANTQPWIRNVLRLGAYQILFLDRVPAHAAVDESVKLAHKYAHTGAAGLVNSVLRRLAEERATLLWPEGDDAASLAVWGSHPLWIVERWLARFGPAETRALLTADNRTVPTGLRANTLKNTRGQLVDMLAREGVEARPAELSPDLVWVEGHHSPGALHSFREGLCTAQDESEALVGRVVAPKAQERVLDLCAAPGGKSTHLAELMGDEGEVWAMERDAHRVETLKATLTRLGTHSVHVVHGDGRTYEFPMPFDRVLVDAPCSGMGVLARRADARWRKGPEVLAEMPPVQLELLRSAARRVVPGGRLVYSVCSFEPEETEHVVARFLAEHPDWALESVAGSVPDAVVTEEGFMRVLPHRHGCDGAFAARFCK